MDLPRILYVDDFKVITARSAMEGLNELDRNPDIHVVISDLKMPRINGLEFIKMVKKQDPRKICMLLTGFMESDVLLEGFNKELIFNYLMKPWEKAQLKQTILEALTR